MTSTKSLFKKYDYRKNIELDMYLKENVEIPNLIGGSEYDILSFWKVNSAKFMILSLLSKDVLAMQVSYVASESVFNTIYRILDPSRSCLTHYMVNVLMCTEQWLKCEIRLKGKGIAGKEQMLKVIEEEYALMRGISSGFLSLYSLCLLSLCFVVWFILL